MSIPKYSSMISRTKALESERLSFGALAQLFVLRTNAHATHYQHRHSLGFQDQRPYAIPNAKMSDSTSLTDLFPGYRDASCRSRARPPGAGGLPSIRSGMNRCVVPK